jgi:hypothetical protein
MPTQWAECMIARGRMKGKDRSAREATRLVVARVRLAAGDGDAGEGPASWVSSSAPCKKRRQMQALTAGARAAEDVVVLGRGGDGASDLVERDASDRDAGGRLASGLDAAYMLMPRRRRG